MQLPADLASEWSGLTESSKGAERPRHEMDHPMTKAAKATKQKVWVTKNAPILTSNMARSMPCDRCDKAGRPCLRWMNGGQALSTCAGCYILKMSCKTGVNTAISRNKGEKLEATVIVKVEVEVPEQVDPKDKTEKMP